MWPLPSSFLSRERKIKKQDDLWIKTGRSQRFEVKLINRTRNLDRHNDHV